MSGRTLLSGLPVLALIATAVLAQQTPGRSDELESDVARLVSPYLENKVIVGLSVGVHRKGTSTVTGYGQVSHKSPRRPVGDTVYEIGSTSKVFTGVLLADAVVRGEVRLDQPAGELLPPRVKMPETDGRPIRLVDLATHVSGLPRLPSNFAPKNPSDPYRDFTVKDLHAFLNGHRADRAPGATIEYSNLGMGLLGQLLAQRSKTSYEVLLRKRIAAPLMMSDTTIRLSKSQRERLAPPHLADGTPAANWNIPTLAGAGAIRSTASDVLRFLAANLHPPEGELGEAIDLAWKVHQQPIAEGDFAMGLAWHIARDGSTRWHNGQTGGYHAMMLANRELDLAVVVLANTAAGEVDALAQDIFRLAAGASVEPREFDETAEVDSAVLKRYVGKYELVPGFVLTVTTEDDRLMVGATGQQTFQVFPRSETEWYYKVVEATLTFKVDDQGRCEAVELFQNGARQTAKRIE